MASVHLTKARLSDAGIGVFFRPGQLDALGITYHQLRRLEASGEVEHVARGLYRLADVEVTEHYSLAAACARVPRSIICLLSALRVHGIGSEAPHEVWLVLDATTGQNAISQARIFNEAIGITGIILTKLDGTAKGGIVVGIAHQLGIPIRYIGIGEKIDDLRPFEPEAFVKAMFD